MKKVLQKKPKKGDILVLAENRDVIYEFNENNPKGNPNACKVAVHLYDSIGKDPVVNYKFSDLDCVAYDAPWDYATPEEIDKFNKAIEWHKTKEKKTEILKFMYDFCKKYYDGSDNWDLMKKEMTDIINDL